MRLRVFASLMLVTCGGLLVSAAALGQGIHKWQTPDGKLYFGDRPPAGSRDLGVMERAPDRGGDDGGHGWEASAERGFGDGGSCDKENMSVSASNRRGLIEKQICARVEHLNRIDAARTKMLSAPGSETFKMEGLRLFQESQREENENINKLRSQFSALGALVRKCFGGTPDWWRDKLSCP